MKKILVILTATITLALSNKAEAQVYGGISFNTFYNELSPYGRWVNNAQYGQVWIADAPGFEPYYNNGHWVYTSYGWTWVSDYAWGWAPFHYGRWTHLTNLGWAWVPGYEWGPAWVGWCQNDGYYGWAPLSPGLGFNFSYNSIPYNYWRFVPQQYIAGPSVRNHIIMPGRNGNRFRNVTIINNTQVNNNITYVAGPQREAVERVTRQKIAVRPVAFTGTDERTKVEQKEVRMYRPDLKPKPGTAVRNGQTEPAKEAVQQDRQPKNGIPGNVPVKPLPNTAAAPANIVTPAIKESSEQPINQEDGKKIKPLPTAPKTGNETARDEPGINNLPNEREARKRLMEKNNELIAVPQNNQRYEGGVQQRVQEQQMKEQQIKARQAQPQQNLQQQNEQQRQNELKQQRVQQQQLLLQQAQEEKIQQQRAQQQQNEQRQNEIRQQQAREQKDQRQRDLQQQNLQRQNEMRQQQQQEQRVQQQRNMQQQKLQQQNEIKQQRIPDATMRQQRQPPMNPTPPSRKPREN